MVQIALAVMIMCLNATSGNIGWAVGCCGEAHKKFFTK